jgi:hypothetical protein
MSSAFDVTDQTIMRFNCKMALLWSPSTSRFAFADDAARYYTACTFEEHMWHHAYVAVDDFGQGSPQSHAPISFIFQRTSVFAPHRRLW